MNKKKKQNSGLTVSSNTKPVDKHCKQWYARNIILYLHWDTGPLNLLKEDPASEPEQDLVFARLPSEQGSCQKATVKKPPRCVFLSPDSIRSDGYRSADRD